MYDQTNEQEKRNNYVQLKFLPLFKGLKLPELHWPVEGWRPLIM